MLEYIASSLPPPLLFGWRRRRPVMNRWGERRGEAEEGRERESFFREGIFPVVSEVAKQKGTAV